MAENRRPERLGQENNNHNGNHHYQNNNYNNNSLTLPLDQFDTHNSTPSNVSARAMEKRIDFTSLKGPHRTPKTAKGARMSPMPMRPRNAVDNTLSTDGQRSLGGKEAEREALLAIEIDTQRMQLISPPPEEMLTLRRHSRLSSGGMSTPGAATPRPAASTTETPATNTKTTTTKRKRNQQSLHEHATPRTTSGNHIADGTPMDIDRASSLQPQSQSRTRSHRRGHSQEEFDVGPVEATPNPKPRKIRHRMPDNESPTKPRLPRSATRAAYRERVDQDMEDEDSATEKDTASPPSSVRTSPRKKGAYATANSTTTTPSRPKRTLVQSPHVKNPDADWLPPVSALTLASVPSRRATLGARRRSETPIPPYEPPTDVFTPPREVFLSPPAAVSKSAKRKTKAPPTASKAKGSARKPKTSLRVNTAQVKLEIPDDIDLLAPMPPPSPSDDPLLLSGPPEPVWESSPLRGFVRRRASAREIALQAQPETIEEVPEDDGVLPPSSPEPPLDSEDMRAVSAFNWDAPGSMDTQDDSMMHVDPADADVEPVALFGFGEDVGEGDGDGWSDSDTEMEVSANPNEKGKPLGGGVAHTIVEEGEGEYTGRWRTMLVRTKMDPPSSATRERQDQWGHPISPYPKIKGKRLTFVGEDEDQQQYDQPQEDREEDEKEKEEEHEDEEEEEHEEEREEEDHEEEEEEEENKEEEEVRRMSVEPEEHLDASLEVQVEAPLPEGLSNPVQLDTVPAIEPVVEDEDLEEEQEVQQISVDMEDEEEDGTEVDLSQFTAPAATVHTPRPQETVIVDEAEADDDDDTSVDDDEPGFVKITSSDPRAAARAAAILKQHDYECYTKLLLKRRHSEAKQRRASYSGVEGLAKESRRRDLASSAISKSTSKNKNWRKSTLGISVIGETVFIPGTPVTTLPALLQEAEKEVVRDIEHVHDNESPRSVWNTRAIFEGAAQKDLFKTPLPSRRLSSLSNPRTESRATPLMLPVPVFDDAGERVWTKDEWKQLDACFTDQRLDIGATLPGANEDMLALVDMVRVDDVVDRFVELMGGMEVVEKWGEAWSREDLLERARALERRQRSGHGARPSTPRTPFSFSSPRPSISSFGAQQSSNIEVPDFTPLLNRRNAPHPRKPSSLSRPILPEPILQATPFSNLTPERERPIRSIPKSLLAPRYSHLLEEAIAVSQQGQYGVPSTQKDMGGNASFSSTSGAGSQEGDESRDMYQDQDEDDKDDDSANTTTRTPAPHSNNDNRSPSTLSTRVKGFLFSYLPRLSKNPPIPTPTLKASRPGLPLPPPDVLSKQRGPVNTPERPPIPKTKPPKDLVELHHAPAPLPKSGIPRPAAPKRLVELKGVGMPVEKPVVQREVRPRRSSGSSVKDLVKGFENMSRKGNEEAVLKRTKSVNEMRRAWKAGQPDTRPKWR